MSEINHSYSKIDHPSVGGAEISPEYIAKNYSINGASPALPSLVRAEQEVISKLIENRLADSIPDHFSDSMRRMISIAHMNTTSTLGIENQCSYNKVSGTLSSTAHHAEARARYERGQATPIEVLETLIDLDMNSAELMKRTELTEELPDDLKTDLVSLYESIADNQTPEDRLGPSRQSVKIKQIDIPIGTGGLNGLIISAKTDFATICSGEYTVTQRTKTVVDITAMPMLWRSRLRKLVASVDISSPEGDSKKVDESKVTAELFNRMLDLPNPENPSQTLRTTTSESPFVYDLATTVYAYRTLDRD